MAGLQQSVVIDRPPAEVFTFVSDLENDPPWSGAAELRRTSPGPLGVGTTFRQRDRILGRPLELSMEVVGYQPNHQIALRATSRLLSLGGARTVEPVGAAATPPDGHRRRPRAWAAQAGRAAAGRRGATALAAPAGQPEAPAGGPALAVGVG